MGETLIKIEDLSKVFFSHKAEIRAVDHVSFTIRKGETVGIVGESGCGKTTLGRCIVCAHKATEGKVLYQAADGTEYDLQTVDKKTMKSIRKEVQMIFQDPFSSLDPRMTVYDILSEPLRANFKLPAKELEEKVKSIAQKVGLNPSYLKRYPHAFSGGQRQRIGIARALVLLPRLIVCDEAVSALDVSVQAQVINLLKDLQREMDLTYLFISHDLSVVEHISDKVGVMYLGQMVEYAPSDMLFCRPLHPYTEALLSAAPVADPDIKQERIPLEGEIPNPADAPEGCYFHTRCRYCEEKCRTEAVKMQDLEKGHFVACHRAAQLKLSGIKQYERKQCSTAETDG